MDKRLGLVLIVVVTVYVMLHFYNAGTLPGIS